MAIAASLMSCANNSTRILYHTVSHIAHITRFSQHHKAASQRGGGEGLRLQSQGDQDLCAAAAAEHLIFKTSTEEQTVDLPNKGRTKDSQRFSRCITYVHFCHLCHPEQVFAQNAQDMSQICFTDHEGEDPDFDTDLSYLEYAKETCPTTGAVLSSPKTMI
jgi:hypothetical protein